MQAMLAHLPKWFSSDRFSIQAKAPIPDPTKDQMRLMVRSLLKDRFQLAMHFETQETSAFLLELAKPGKLGPNLRPHQQGPPCDKPDDRAFPPHCDIISLTRKADKLMTVGSRHTTLELIAAAFPGMGGLDRPVVDRTGLTGRYDFKLEWTDESPASQPNSSTTSDGPSFTTALREQLGLKLESAKVPLRLPVIDRVERPSEN